MRRVVASSLLVALTIGCVTEPETGEKKFDILSESQENELGEQAFKEVLAKEHETTDAHKREIVARVGRRIANVTTRPDWKWEFKTIESKEANAFFLPGGKIVVYTGLFPHLGNEAGLATVLGHEVAHATARHAGQRISQQLIVEAGLDAASITLGNAAYHNSIMALLGA